MKITVRSGIAGSLLFICLLGPADWARGLFPQKPDSSPQQSGQHPAQQMGQGSQVTVPSRPESPIYSGEQGPQKSEIEFAPVSRTVTIKLQVQDPNGYFLPNIRRENFVVYEDGVRQKNVSVEVEHAAVSIGLLLESGGRYHELNKVLGFEIPIIGRQALEVLGRNDKIAVFKYGAKLPLFRSVTHRHCKSATLSWPSAIHLG